VSGTKSSNAAAHYDDVFASCHATLSEQPTYSLECFLVVITQH